MPYVTVKVPVFSFAKMRGVETILGPEMKSTGEVLGIDATFAGALRKGFIAAGIRIPDVGSDLEHCHAERSGEAAESKRRRILVSLADDSKEQGIAVLRRYVALGFTLVATDGTHQALTENGIVAKRINKISDGSPHVLDTIASRSVDLVINDAAGPRELSDGYRIPRAAVETSVACLTSLDTARALVQALESTAGPPRTLQEYRQSVVSV
jgi:carbamoyl-phosphate synthase large subunit